MRRRDFLKVSIAAGGSLVVGFNLAGCSQGPPLPNANDSDLTPNAFLQITPDGTVILQLNKAEMGQGVAEGFATLVAEEMGLKADQIQVEMAQYHPDLKDPEMSMMLVGGSSSVRVFWKPLREVAARTRELLLAAAARQWQVERGQLRIEDGYVVAGQRRAHFGEFITTAKELPVPEQAPLTEAGRFRLIGTERTRWDARVKVTGEAVFGIDVNQPDALSAVVVSCPHFGGALASVDVDAAEASPGVRAVERLPDAVAVIADSYWLARQASEKLQVTWDKGPMAGIASADLRRQQQALLEADEFYTAEEKGEAPADPDTTVLEAEYHVPFLAHATMEPMNAVAWVQADRVDVWSGVQGIEMAMAGVARAIDRPMEQVHIHNQYLGGGFGRRIMPDYCAQAAVLSQRTGKPVKVIWSREDDTRHDFYRPMSTIRYRGQLVAGKPVAVEGRVACPGVMGYLAPQMAHAMVPGWVPDALINWAGNFVAGRDPSSTEGLIEQPYDTGYYRIDYARHDVPVPVGFWRSVGHSQNAFFTESFIDELANAAGRDPLEYRYELIGDRAPRWRAVLDLVAKAAPWGQPAPGRHQGLAVHESFQTVVAQVAEISVENGTPRVHRVVAAVDCGTAVNPDMVRSQIEGGIVYGLTAALYGEITLEDGAVVQSNFHDYPALRLHETPEIEVHIVASEANPTGIGEPGVPPLAPAVANAIFRATGQRLRELPLRLTS